jgi:hemerythrin superfamily protein
MTDVFSSLAADHKRIFQLINELTGGAGMPSGRPAERKRTAERLVIEESRHEAAEEAVYWPLVRDRVEGGAALALAAQTQEQGAKRLLNELDHISPRNDEFASVISLIASAVRDHITFEESQVWPKLRLGLPDDEARRAGEALDRARAAAPTRPHPHTPPDPRLLRIVGPAIVAADRARDVLTGRGRR